MNDKTIFERITELSDEELRLEAEMAVDSKSPGTRDRLGSIEVELDQCWDLLRQRRARRSAGQDPEEATVRPGNVVENYHR